MIVRVDPRPEFAAAREPNWDQMKQPVGFLLIGAGPHARRTYIPHLMEFEKKEHVRLRMIVEVEETRESVNEYLEGKQSRSELLFVPPFASEMPEHVASDLDEAVSRLNISVVIISTEPLAHKVYAMWAMERGLNIIMDKPISARCGSCSSIESAHGIARDYVELLSAYQDLQQRRRTCFLVNSHRRYHPGIQFVCDAIRETREKSGCPVTNLSLTHCDGMWRTPTELVDMEYHTYSRGYGKVSHSGYHFLDACYLFLKSGWTEDKRPTRLEVISSFVLPNGFVTALNNEDHRKLFGSKDYEKASKYTDEELRELMENMGEVDASIQITAYRGDDAIALAQVNLQHNGFSRRSWLELGPDLYKGTGRVRHEMHEIKSGPLQTVVIDSRQANDKHDRSKPSNPALGGDNHYDIHIFRNSDIFGNGEVPLRSYDVHDLCQRYNTERKGLYGENIKCGILDEAIGFVHGAVAPEQLRSSIEDHSVAVHLMSASYLSHVRRIQGLNPIVTIRLAYQGDQSQASITEPFVNGPLGSEYGLQDGTIGQ